MPSVLRESTDTSAPTLTGESGSLTNLLKAVLVNGYGSKDPLGWSIAFEDDTSKELVIRSDSGTRFFVKISDNRIDYDYKFAYCVAYESMADIDTGYGPCPSDSLGEYRNIFKSDTTGSVEVPWKIIGDNKGFWILTKAFNPQYGESGYGLLWEPHYIGDYTPLNITNKYNFMTILHHSNGYGYFQPNSDVCVNLMRHPDTFENGSVGAMLTQWHSGDGHLYGNSILFSPKYGRYYYETPMMWLDGVPHGTAPGFYSMLWRTSSVAASTGYYHFTNEELADFFEGSTDKKMFIFPFRYINYSPISVGHDAHRGSILIGEGFRNA